MEEDIDDIKGLTFADISGNGITDISIEFMRHGPQGPYMNEFFLYNFVDDQLGANLLSTIENGFGHKTHLKYQPFNYSYKRASYDYPLSKFVDKTYLIRDAWQDNGLDGKMNHISFLFKNPVKHKAGKGFLGFQETTVTNFQTNTKTITEFSIFEDHNKYYHPYPNTVKQYSLHERIGKTDKLLMEITNTLGVKKTVTGADKDIIYLPVITQSVTSVWDNNEAHSYVKAVKTIQEISDIDIYGNSHKNTVITNPYPFKETDDTFYFKTVSETDYNLIDVDNWLVGRPTGAIITKYNYNAHDTTINEVHFGYYKENEICDSGVKPWPSLKYKKTIPNNSEKNRTVVCYDNYDEYGNVLQKTVKAPGANPPIENRVTEYEYSTEHNHDARFLTKTIKEIDGVKYISEYIYNPITGKIMNKIDPAGLVTVYEYDDFGKPEVTIHPDRTQSEVYYRWSDGEPDAPINAMFYTIQQKRTTDAQEYEIVKTFYDKLDRKSVV